MTDSLLVYDIGPARYINLTNACNLRCNFCPRTEGDYKVHDYDLKLSKQPRWKQVVEALGPIEEGKEYVFCGYGEPTCALKDLLKVAKHIKKRGGRVRLNTNGLGNQINKRDIVPDLKRVVDAISISLNAQDEELYNKHCQPTKPHAYQFLKSFIELSVKSIPEVTVTAINGLEGVDINACKAIANELGAEFRQRELDQLG